MFKGYIFGTNATSTSFLFLPTVLYIHVTIYTYSICMASSLQMLVGDPYNDPVTIHRMTSLNLGSIFRPLFVELALLNS